MGDWFRPSSRLQQMQLRAEPGQYPRLWEVDCTSAAFAAPAYACYVLACPCCASYQLRKRALYGDMSRYRCCNGYIPFIDACCCEDQCPRFCLGLETVACFTMSVWSTRFMIQDEMRLQADPCDMFIISTLICLETMACVCSCVACLTGNQDAADCSQCCHFLAEVLWLVSCCCMQTQHHIQLDVRDNKRPSSSPTQPPTQQQIPMGPINPMGYSPAQPRGYPLEYSGPPPPPHPQWGTMPPPEFTAPPPRPMPYTAPQQQPAPGFIPEPRKY